MDKLRALFARVRLPVFSIKHPETFQVMSCLPIPQPSALVGALAYCIGAFNGIGVKALENLRKIMAGKSTLITRAKLLDMVAVTPIILRRFRVADEFHKRKNLYEIASKKRYDLAKLFLEKKLMDAFYRDYAMGHEILCLWLFGDGFKLDEAIVRLMLRLGDTESLVSVLDVWAEDVEVIEATMIRTPFPFPLRNASLKSGDFILVRMCNELRIQEQYVIPIRHEMRQTDTGRTMILKPAEVEAEYVSPISYCETSEGAVILT